jgi:hypothetical protein
MLAVQLVELVKNSQITQNSNFMELNLSKRILKLQLQMVTRRYMSKELNQNYKKINSTSK